MGNRNPKKERKKGGELHAWGGKSAFIFHVLCQNTLIFAWEGGQAHAKTVQLARKGVGKCDAKYLRKCGCRTSPPSISMQDPPAGLCQGFVTVTLSPGAQGTPGSPLCAPSPIPSSPMRFYSFCKHCMPDPTSQLALLHVFVFCACAALASSACATAPRWRRRGGRGAGEGNGSRLPLAKPLFV